MATATSVAVTRKPAPRRLSESQSQSLISKEAADPAVAPERPQSRRVHDALPDIATQWLPVSYQACSWLWGANQTRGLVNLIRCSGLRTLGFSAPAALGSRAVLSRASHALYSNANSITEVAARDLAQTPLSCASFLITPKNGLQAHVQFAPPSEH